MRGFLIWKEKEGICSKLVVSNEQWSICSRDSQVVRVLCVEVKGLCYEVENHTEARLATVNAS